MGNKEPKFVEWQAFVWVVSIVTLLMAALFGIVISLMGSLSDIKSDISSIKTDVVWIKGAVGGHGDVSLSNK